MPHRRARPLVPWLLVGPIALRATACSLERGAHGAERRGKLRDLVATGLRWGRWTLRSRCSRGTRRSKNARRGSGARSRAVPGGDVLYVTDEDHACLRVIALPLAPAETSEAGRPIAPQKVVATPGRPANVLVTTDRALITVRDPSLLLVMRPDAEAGLVEIGRVALPLDAWGLAITPDGQTVLVTSAWGHQVSAIDLASMQLRWSVDVAREPRGVVVRADGRGAYVSHLTSSTITRIDGITDAAPRARSVALPAAPLRAAGGLRSRRRSGTRSRLSPDGARLFAPRHALGGAAEHSVVRRRRGRRSPHRERHAARAAAPGTSCSRAATPHPSNPDGRSRRGRAAAGARDDRARSLQPRASALIRARTGTLLVAGEGDDVLVELDARAIDPALQVLSTRPVGCAKAPSGFALSSDDGTAYVLCRTSNELAIDPARCAHRRRAGEAAGPAPRGRSDGRARGDGAAPLLRLRGHGDQRRPRVRGVPPGRPRRRSRVARDRDERRDDPGGRRDRTARVRRRARRRRDAGLPTPDADARRTLARRGPLRMARREP